MSTKPPTVRDMAYRRGLYISKAKHGGWYVTMIGAPWGAVLYASHNWMMIQRWIKKQPIMLKRKDIE